MLIYALLRQQIFALRPSSGNWKKRTNMKWWTGRFKMHFKIILTIYLIPASFWQFYKQTTWHILFQFYNENVLENLKAKNESKCD